MNSPANAFDKILTHSISCFFFFFFLRGRGRGHSVASHLKMSRFQDPEKQMNNVQLTALATSADCANGHPIDSSSVYVNTWSLR